MKLLDINPFIIESSEDDPFAESTRPPVTRELVLAMAKREHAIEHELDKVRTKIDRLIVQIPGVAYIGGYPGGRTFAMKCVANKTLIKILTVSNIPYVVPNVPESLPFVTQIHTLYARKHKLDDLYKKNHQKLVRDKRTVAKRETHVERRRWLAEVAAKVVR